MLGKKIMIQNFLNKDEGVTHTCRYPYIDGQRTLEEQVDIRSLMYWRQRLPSYSISIIRSLLIIELEL